MFLITKYMTVITFTLESIYCSGAIFGWSALDYVLTEEGYFTQNCFNGTTLNDTRQKIDANECPSQRYYMGLVFTLALVISSFLSPVGGYVMDHFGVWLLRTISSMMYIASCLAVAFSTPETSWILFPAMTIMAISEHFIFPTNVQTANLFPKFRATVNSLLHAAFTASVITFTIVKSVYGVGFTIFEIFLFMAFLGFLMLVRTFFLLPKTVIPYDIPSDYHYSIKDCCSKAATEHESQHLLEPLTSSNNDFPSLKSCVFSSLYLLATFTLVIQWVRIDVYIESLNSFLQYLRGNDTQLLKYDVGIFGYFHILAFIFVPINGLIFDFLLRYYEMSPSLTSMQARKRSLSVMCLISSCISIIYSIFALILNAELLYATFILIVMHTVFACANVPLLLIQLFPMKHFGTLFGLVFAIYAVGMALQYGLYFIEIMFLQNNFFFINALFLVLCIATLSHPIDLYRKSLSP